MKIFLIKTSNFFSKKQTNSISEPYKFYYKSYFNPKFSIISSGNIYKSGTEISYLQYVDKS